MMLVKCVKNANKFSLKLKSRNLRQQFKSEKYKLSTIRTNKNGLNSDNRIQAIDSNNIFVQESSDKLRKKIEKDNVQNTGKIQIIEKQEKYSILIQ